MECALLGTLLEVSIEFEKRGVVDLFAVRGEDAVQSG